MARSEFGCLGCCCILLIVCSQRLAGRPADRASSHPTCRPFCLVVMADLAQAQGLLRLVEEKGFRDQGRVPGTWRVELELCLPLEKRLMDVRGVFHASDCLDKRSAKS